MLNGDDNRKGSSRLMDLINKKTNCTCSTFFCLSLAKFPSYTLFLWRNCRMCLPNISVFPVFMFAFIFHCRSFSPCWPLAFLIFSPRLWISTFFSLRNSTPLFSITRSSSFSVIHVSLNIKNNAEKDTTLLLFFLSKSLGGHVILFKIKPWVAFGLPYLLIELFYIGMPVVRTDGRSLGVR